MGDFAQLNDNEAELLSGGGGKEAKGKKDSSNNKPGPQNKPNSR